jgi:Putative Flp pilus-assembly TadE/G-like
VKNTACEIKNTNKNTREKIRKPFFVLTRKNQKGQVAIFVALIFQIVFIFFALLINVGLLVHHKINLQQSTDLAAYYGAMKQAEMLNVISHVNFQMRQAWKLLTWRYRILGTFGFVPTNNVVGNSGYIDLPIRMSSSTTPVLTYSDLNSKCTSASGDQYNLNDLPSYCIAHVGFGDWPAQGSETSCKLNCSSLSGAASVIPSLNNINTVSVPGANVAGAINNAITTANNNLEGICKATTNIGSAQLANILTAYIKEILSKKVEMNLLTKNLLSGAGISVDLDGNELSKGALATLKNNLTEANLSSLSTNYKFMNGISDDNDKVNGCSDINNVFSEVKYQLIQFYMQICIWSGGRNDTFESIYQPGTNTISTKLSGAINNQVAALLNDVLSNQFVSGFEKNPWCNVYFGARSSTEPKIPFLPISKIKLSAVSFAKPFGGSIGPWYYKKWNSGEINSDSTVQQTDTQMPLRKINSNPSSAMQANIEIMLNYSNYIGDTKGLKDHQIIGVYHDLLLTRNLQGTSPIASTAQVPADRKGAPIFTKPTFGWPKFSNWSQISADVDMVSYDPLALVDGGNSHLRDLEISVVAPNQFETSYYSIEPDFYQNYFKDRLDNSKGLVNKLKNIAGVSSSVIFRPDYGFSSTGVVGLPKDYSVRHQLAVVEQVFKSSGGGIGQLLTGAAGNVADKYFTFIPKSPASLLTGWSFLNLTNAAGYSTFPTEGTGTTMPFGKCKDAPYLSDEYKSLADPAANPPKPPAPGNCVTGGRTGYSVKIVSEEAINGQQGPIGGEGTSGEIRNKIPASFLNF